MYARAHSLLVSVLVSVATVVSDEPSVPEGDELSLEQPAAIIPIDIAIAAIRIKRIFIISPFKFDLRTLVHEHLGVFYIR